MRRLMANAIFPAALLFFGASTVQQTVKKNTPELTPADLADLDAAGDGGDGEGDEDE